MRRVLLRFALGLALILIAFIAYMASLSPCNGNELPMGLPIASVGPGYVTTDQGRLYLGQTYVYQNEGPWVGNMTLIVATSTWAIVLVRYPPYFVGTESGGVCRDIFPLKD